VYAMRFFYADPTHGQPVSPDTLSFLVKTRGFVDARTIMLNPVECPRDNMDPGLWNMLYGDQDYAVVAFKF
jgi:hypothetical protein